MQAAIPKRSAPHVTAFGAPRPAFGNGPDEGGCHDTKTEPVCRCAYSHAIVARLWKAILHSSPAVRLTELAKIRASQLKGCAFCLHTHTTSARKLGKTRGVFTCLMSGANRRSTASAN